MIARNRFGKFETPVLVDGRYRVLGYHTGDFVGDWHAHEHELVSMRVGVLVDVRWKFAKFETAA